jgi:cytochrome c-type biogenesis protein CcmF
MEFEGEHLLPGKLGHFFVLLAFISSIVSTVAYLAASRSNDLSQKQNWIRYARVAFGIQVISILSIFSLIIFICSNHYYEYLYAYKHASRELESRYLLACVWEGQEGSFLLWSIWHAILGFILMFRAKEWEAPVMTIVSLAQVFLSIMLIGLWFGDVRIGSNPFVLTRNELEGPIFSQPNYLSFIKDGMGLNVLLRNYWMVIHPPVLFLGFASTLIPVAYAYGGLSTRKYGDWIKPALPWTLFSVAVLGVGIMMGSKWAYESLSFGGYWAWDPVENASLVPWLILIAGLHCMLIYRATKHSLTASYLFVILTLFFVLYSTFLTRTGILGDSSVHSFTEAGMAMNILIGLFVLGLTLPVLVMFIIHLRKIPAITKEESFSSREFWMFIGALVFFLSALFIIGFTSVPVYNKLFGLKLAMPENFEMIYNKVMVLVAIIIGLMTATTQYLRYKDTEKNTWVKKIIVPTIISILVMVALWLTYPLDYEKEGPGYKMSIYFAVFAGIYSIVANAGYIWIVLKGNLKAAGASISHLGFALMITGMLITSSNSQVISDNRTSGVFIPFEEDPDGKHTENPMENLTLLKEVPTKMADYYLTYIGDSAGHEKNRSFFKLLVEKKDPSGEIKENFVLKPDVYKMKDNNLSSNPDIKHYFTHDVFTYISSVPDRSSMVDTVEYTTEEAKIGDSIFFSNGYMILNSVQKNPKNERFSFTENDTALVADITVVGKDSSRYKAYPLLKISNFEIAYVDDTVFAKNLHLRLVGLADNTTFKIGVKESNTPMDFVTLKAYVFPYINLVWVGLILMAAGILASLMQRLRVKPAISAITILFITGLLFYVFLVAN